MKVQGRNDIHKDLRTGVVHYNINRNEMAKAREAKKNKRAEMDMLKNEVKEIKDMLKTLMEKL